MTAPNGSLDTVTTEAECIKIVSVDGTLLDMSPAGLRMVEADALSEVAGKPVIDLVHPEHRDAFWALHKLSARGEIGRLQFRVIGRKGGVRWLDTHSAPLKNARGEISAVFSITRDITEHLKTQAALGESERLRKSLLDNVSEGIYGVDKYGNITFLNNTGASFVGWQAHEAAGRNAHQLLHHHHGDGTDYPEAECPISQCLRLGVAKRVDDDVFFRKDGRAFPVAYACSPLYDQAGSIVGVVVNFRDVSERKAAEEVLANRVQQQAAVAKLGIEITRGASLQHVFQQAAHLVTEALHVDLCKVLRLEPDGNTLSFCGHVGWRADTADTVKYDDGAYSQPGFALHADQPIFVNDFKEERRFRMSPLMAAHDVVSGMSV